MDIIKRNGRTITFNPQKLIKRLTQHTEDDTLRKYIDRAVIDCQSFFYDGITTKEIDRRLAQCVSQLSIYEPELTFLAGKVIITSLLKDIEHLNYNYTDNPKLLASFVKKYNKVEKPVMEEPKMSYFAAVTLEKEFLLRNEREEVVESPTDFYWRIALATSTKNKQAFEFYDQLVNRGFSTSNPIAVNAGTNKGKLISCTTVSISGDSREGILDVVNSAATHSANNSGLGIYIGDVRSKDTLRSKGGKASGIRKLVKTLVPFSQFFAQSEKRRGAFALYCDIWHRDIRDFIPMKRQDLNDSLTDQNGFYGICIPDLFYKRFSEKKTWSLMCPHDVFKEYGWKLSDFVAEEFEEKYNLIESENKIDLVKVDSSELMMQLVDAMAASGVPYIFNRDNSNRDHQQKHLGVLKSQQLCVAGNTLITTKCGLIKISELDGQEVEAWNGKEWSNTKFFKTGEDRELLGIKFSNGETIQCTPNHKFFIKNTNDNSVREVEAKDLIINDKLSSWKRPILESELSLSINGGNANNKGFYSDETETINDITVTSITEVDGLHDTYCGTEPKEHKLMFNNIQASNCNEFSGIHNEEFEAQCDLGSIPLPYHIKDGKFDFESLSKSVKSLTRLLNNVIDINEWNTEKAKKAGLEHRNIGIGLLGLADVFAQLDMVYGDFESRELNKEIQKTIYVSALEESNRLAIETGKGMKDTLVCREPQEWLPTELKESLKKYGVMNHLLTCNMPTSTTSKLLDVTQSFEVFDFPISYRETVLGEFKIVNRYLVEDLKKIGFWNDEIATDLVRKNNVSTFDIPQHIKDKYQDKYHHSNKIYLEMGADRQKFLDQGQSMNLYYDKPERSKISTALYYGWKLGLPSGSYYTTILKQKDDNVMISSDSVKEALPPKPQDSKFDCFGCD